MVVGSAKASEVRAYGDGLKGALVGVTSQFTISTLQAGAGELDISIDGPTELKIECFGNEDGTYRVEYKPERCGKYMIKITFDGEQIPGSPYPFQIVGTKAEVEQLLATASKCKVKGQGIKSARLNQSNSFTVNAGKAGRGSVMVGVEGPSSAKEIAVKHLGNNEYSVNYTLDMKGKYKLKVLWGESHVPGSPFSVKVS